MPVKSFKLDVDKTLSGLWVSVDNNFEPCSEENDGTEKILIAYWPNENVVKLRGQLQKPFRKVLDRGGSIPEQKAREITAELIARHVWLDSQNLVFDGPFEHNPANVKKIIFDPAWVKFVDALLITASDETLFSANDIAADSKN